MKSIILTLLRSGYTKTRKYSIEDLARKLYVLRPLLRIGVGGDICCNENAFWMVDNNPKRGDLITDIYRVHRFEATDPAYFHIINRFENGDGYGIARASV